MKRLLYAAAALALAASLSGCITLSGVTNPINQTEVYQVGNAYGTVKAVAVAYAGLPLCPRATTITISNICHDKAVLKQVDLDVHAADTAYFALQAFVTNPANYPTLKFSTLLADAESAIATVSQIEAQYNLGKAS